MRLVCHLQAQVGARAGLARFGVHRGCLANMTKKRCTHSLISVRSRFGAAGETRHTGHLAVKQTTFLEVFIDLCFVLQPSCGQRTPTVHHAIMISFIESHFDGSIYQRGMESAEMEKPGFGRA